MIKKGKNLLKAKNHVTSIMLGKNLRTLNLHETLIEKEADIGSLLQLQNLSLLFIFEKEITSFSYKCTISTTEIHGVQHYHFHGRANLYRLCRLWKMS